MIGKYDGVESEVNTIYGPNIAKPSASGTGGSTVLIVNKPVASPIYYESAYYNYISFYAEVDETGYPIGIDISYSDYDVVVSSSQFYEIPKNKITGFQAVPSSDTFVNSALWGVFRVDTRDMSHIRISMNEEHSAPSVGIQMHPSFIQTVAASSDVSESGLFTAFDAGIDFETIIYGNTIRNNIKYGNSLSGYASYVADDNTKFSYTELRVPDYTETFLSTPKDEIDETGLGLDLPGLRSRVNITEHVEYDYTSGSFIDPVNGVKVVFKYSEEFHNLLRDLYLQEGESSSTFSLAVRCIYSTATSGYVERINLWDNSVDYLGNS